jgi:sec-independent protein translocase protein TatA
MRPQFWQIVVIVVALVLLFGWKRLPDMARSVGRSMRIFKSEVELMVDKDKDDKDQDPGSPSAASRDTVHGRAEDRQGEHPEDRRSDHGELRRSDHGEARGSDHGEDRTDEPTAPIPGSVRDDEQDRA